LPSQNKDKELAFGGVGSDQVNCLMELVIPKKKRLMKRRIS